jgi:hypothetical protein
MGVSGQHHAPAALYPRRKDPRYPLDRRPAGWAAEPVWTQRLEEKSSASVGDRTTAFQSLVSHYTDWATPAPTHCCSVIFTCAIINLLSPFTFWSIYTTFYTIYKTFEEILNICGTHTFLSCSVTNRIRRLGKWIQYNYLSTSLTILKIFKTIPQWDNSDIWTFAI